MRTRVYTYIRVCWGVLRNITGLRLFRVTWNITVGRQQLTRALRGTLRYVQRPDPDRHKYTEKSCQLND